MWERSWYAGALLGASSLLFLAVWACEPSVLTAVSLLGLMWCVADYAGAATCAALLRSVPWTASKERRLDDLCRTLVLHYTHAVTAMESFRLLRTVRPRVYYSVLVAALATLAWLGNAVHNLLLTYLLITGLLLLPGLRTHGFLGPYTQQLSARFTSLLQQKQD